MRRKVNTYGKAGRKILVHDLFQSTHPDVASTLSQSPPQPRTVSIRSDPPLEGSNQHESVSDSIAHLEMRQSSPSSTTASSPSSATNTSNMFDIQSSDDDLPPKQNGPLKKRRKITPATSKPISAVPVARPVEKRNPRIEPRQGSQARPIERVSQARPTTIKQQERASKLSKKNTSGLPSTNTTLTKINTKMTRGKQPPSTMSFASQLSQAKDMRISSGSSIHASDASAPSPRFSRQTTPKRRRRESDEEPANVPSPSDLKMTSLRLTPGHSPSRLSTFSDDIDMTDDSSFQPPARKGRRRLVDRLDAPRQQTQLGMEATTEPDLGLPTDRNFSQNTPKKTILLGPPKLEKQPSDGANTAPPPRAARTYARQRSHLSDMIDGLESNSQHSSQQSYSQPLSFTSHASQMDLDDDESDDAGTFRQPKSIHELRRAGAITKFDNELSTLLDEIESQRKSSRIRALLQLLQKATDINFLRHFQDSSTFARFIDCAGPGLDNLSATLMVLVLQSVTTAAQTSPKASAQILDSLYRLPPILMTINKTLSKMAQDRQHNLPRLLLAELTEFEEARSSNSDSAPTVVSAIFLSALEHTLRTLIKHAEHTRAAPKPLIGELISTLIANQGVLLEGKAIQHHIDNIQLLLSTLEIFSFNQDLVGHFLTTPRFDILPSTLTGIMQWARRDKPQLEQACLRFIVSLSNNHPDICNVFVGGELIYTVYSVVNDHFSRVAAQAVKGQQVDSDRLDAAVLSLGCLLNFADCVDAAREKMLSSIHNGRSMVDGLTDIFNSYFDLTSEVCMARPI